MAVEAPTQIQTPTLDAVWRELDARVNDGISVRLVLHVQTGTLAVSVADTRTMKSFDIMVNEGTSAMDVFHHPYAYEAHRGVVVAHVEHDEPAQVPVPVGTQSPHMPPFEG